MTDPRITSIAQRFAELSRELDQILGTPLASLSQPEAGQASAMENQPKPILTVQEVAELVDTHPRTLRRWAHEGLFPAPIRIGRAVRWRRADIDRWIEEQTS